MSEVKLNHSESTSPAYLSLCRCTASCPPSLRLHPPCFLCAGCLSLVRAPPSSSANRKDWDQQTVTCASVKNHFNQLFSTNVRKQWSHRSLWLKKVKIWRVRIYSSSERFWLVLCWVNKPVMTYQRNVTTVEIPQTCDVNGNNICRMFSGWRHPRVTSALCLTDVGPLETLS